MHSHFQDLIFPLKLYALCIMQLKLVLARTSRVEAKTYAFWLIMHMRGFDCI